MREALEMFPLEFSKPDLWFRFLKDGFDVSEFHGLP